jgi:hypothetical protein
VQQQLAEGAAAGATQQQPPEQLSATAAAGGTAAEAQQAGAATAEASSGAALNDTSSSVSNSNSSSSVAWGSRRRPSLALFLAGYERHAALGVNWVMFGSSGLQQRPAAGPMASYTACVLQEDAENTHVKVRPGEQSTCKSPYVQPHCLCSLSYGSLSFCCLLRHQRLLVS